MSKSPLPILIAVLVACGLGFWIGTFVAKEQPADEPAPTGGGEREVLVIEKPAVPLTESRKDFPALMRGSRLAVISGLIRRVNDSDAPALWALHDDLMQRDRTGGETRIERAIVLYRLGQLEGPDAVRRTFRTDPDHSESVHSVLLEGWAQQDPAAAYAWWQTLPAGNMRASLFDPLLQGCTGTGGDWPAFVLGSVGIEELGARALPLLEAVIERDGLQAAIELFEEHINVPEKNHYGSRQRSVLMLSRRVEASGDAGLMQHFFTSTDLYRAVADEHSKRLLRAIGAADGAAAMGWLAEAKSSSGRPFNNANRRMVIALGWAKAKPAAAEKWLAENRGRPFADEVAFQLAIRTMAADPEKARGFAGQVMDAELAEKISDIVAGYE